MARHLSHLIAASGLAVMVALGSGGDACAFTETVVPPPSEQPRQQQNPSAKLHAPSSGNGLELTTPSDASGGGTEIKIPGLGSVGILPKLDFGLELLYGGNGNADGGRPSEDKDDVQVKGSITHRF
jgi:hypothetical protein